MIYSENTRVSKIVLIWKHCFVMIFLLIQITNLRAQMVTLVWEPSSQPHAIQYNLYRAVNSMDDFVFLGSVAHPDTLFTDANLSWEQHYYYAVTAVDVAGMESGFSNLVDTTLALPLSVQRTELNAHLDNQRDVILQWMPPSVAGLSRLEVQRCKSESTSFDNIASFDIDLATVKQSFFQFVDRDLPDGTFMYRLKKTKADGSFTFSDTLVISVAAPEDYALLHNWPNPFNSSTRISYSVPNDGHVQLDIYNVNGEKVKTLLDEFQSAGSHVLEWHGSDDYGARVATGFYLVQLKAETQTLFRKILLSK